MDNAKYLILLFLTGECIKLYQRFLFPSISCLLLYQFDIKG